MQIVPSDEKFSLGRGQLAHRARGRTPPLGADFRLTVSAKGL